MVHREPSLRYLTQFRPEVPLYNKWEKKYDQCCFRQFGGGRNEITLIRKTVASRLNSSAIVGILASKLGGEDIPNNQALLIFTSRLREKLLRYAQAVPSAREYYERILALIDPLSRVVKHYHEKVEGALQYKLGNFLTNEIHDYRLTRVYSEEINDVRKLTDHYAREMQLYYQFIQSMLETEWNNSDPGNEPTEVENLLLKLTSLIKRSLLNAEATGFRLGKWSASLAKAERQELYN
ncbi:MAG TPA: hypothetical protein VMI35_02400 [Puia sp.]|nr:hypothetical protein [Puia sp.]